MSKGWIGIDLDGTLAVYDGWNSGKIGRPVPDMMRKVKGMLATGERVKIMTARVSTSQEKGIDSGEHASEEFVAEQHKMINDWCIEHVGKSLEVTSVKDFNMIKLYDDRCITVLENTGRCARWNSNGRIVIY